MNATTAIGPSLVSSRPQVHRDIVDEVCATAFASLRRRDQRAKGEAYVRGLLLANGRKSIRNIASYTGDPAAEQSLHHFVSSSTWQWQPVRSALVGYLARVVPLSAWVVHPMPIPKGGRHSVGVGHRFDPERGQTFRGQDAHGVWLAAPGLVTPVSWRLFLPELWQQDGEGQERGGLPANLDEETYEECAAAAVLETAGSCGLPRRPVLLDARGAGLRATVRRFATAGLPLLARIDPSAGLEVADPALPGHGAGPLTAQHILSSVTGLRRPTGWGGSLVAAVRVGLTGPQMRQSARTLPGGQLLLVGEWTDPRRLPSRMWATNLTGMSAAALLGLAQQERRVTRALAHSGEQVGLRHYSGRSYSGWHRHMTLASVAHAALALGDAADTVADLGYPVAASL